MASQSLTKTLSVFAPAKVNLFLHITGRRDSGYHELESLFTFADIGDRLDFSRSDQFTFTVVGPFAYRFSTAEKDSGPDSSNLVVRAVWELSRALKREPKFSLTLTKELPLAAGLGGGSSDAAAAIWGLLELWNVSPQAMPSLDKLLLGLGADVPACFACCPVIAEGIGEKLTPVDDLPELAIVLVNPQKDCPTASVFQNFDKSFAQPVRMTKNFVPEDLIELLLSATGNMLTEAAIRLVPDIAKVLMKLEGQNGCQLARLSGSGATCFGLFTDSRAAAEASKAITLEHPEWWVKAGTLNRPKRY